MKKSYFVTKGSLVVIVFPLLPPHLKHGKLRLEAHGGIWVTLYRMKCSGEDDQKHDEEYTKTDKANREKLLF